MLPALDVLEASEVVLRKGVHAGRKQSEGMSPLIISRKVFSAALRPTLAQ